MALTHTTRLTLRKADADVPGARRGPVLNLSAQESFGVPVQCDDIGGALKWAHRADTPG
jgi:hypothetical protein